jgi:hypothetical protein
MSKIISLPQSGRVGNLVFCQTRYGQVVRQYVCPRDPKSPLQQANRNGFGQVSTGWRALDPAKRIAWCLAAANSYTTSRTGDRVSLNGYNYFIRVNAARVHLGLSQFDLPPAVPSFSPNPVAELAIANTGGTVTVKLRVPGQPGQTTLVQGAAPVSAGVRCVQHFPLLGLLPAPVDGWSDITALYVARYGAPIVGTAIFVRTCQHIDGWTDLPKVASAFVPAG